MFRPSTPPPTPASKRQRTEVGATLVVAAPLDNPVDPRDLLGSPASSSRSRSGTKRPRSSHSASSSASTASPRRQSMGSSSSSNNPPSSPDLSILDPSTKRAVALASPSSRSSYQSPSSVLSFPSSPTATPASRFIRHGKNSTLDSIASSRSGGSSSSSTLAPSSASSSRSLVNASGGSTKSSNSTASSSSSTVGRALSLRERIEAKEQTRLRELEGLTKRHNTLFTRASAGREEAVAANQARGGGEPALGLGTSDADAAVLAGPPPFKLTSSSSRRTSKTSSSSKVLFSRTGSTLGATRHQTAVLMDVLKRKSLLSRLPEIADSLYMLFTHAAAAQGATLSSRAPHLGRTDASSSSESLLLERASDQNEQQEKMGISTITATPRVPVLPLSEVLTSLTRSSRTILSRVELREALSMLVEFVPGFLEIRTVGQGGAEWATLGFGRGSQPLGLKDVREKLRAIV